MFDAGKVDIPANQRNVGMVFQSYAIWPHMTVFDNVAFPLRVKNLARSEIEARVGEVLVQIGLCRIRTARRELSLWWTNAARRVGAQPSNAALGAAVRRAAQQSRREAA
jgi:ABC-type ATPase involved in cell division